MHSASAGAVRSAKRDAQSRGTARPQLIKVAVRTGRRSGEDAPAVRRYAQKGACSWAVGVPLTTLPINSVAVVIRPERARGEGGGEGGERRGARRDGTAGGRGGVRKIDVCGVDAVHAWWMDAVSGGGGLQGRAGSGAAEERVRERRGERAAKKQAGK